jgi:DnaJ-domain-containing protein 1
LFMAAGTMLFAGACWLWSDFINATPNDQLGRFKQKANGRQRQQDANWEREPTAEAQEWWHILDVSPHAKKDEISRSYRRKMQQCHPDRVSGLAPEFHRLAETHAKTLNAAYAEAMGRRA